MEKDLKYRTKIFALDVIEFTDSLGNSLFEREVSRQLIRSAMSVGANTRAAFRGRSKKEFIAKLGIVIEEVDESAFWLELLEEKLEENIESIIKLKKEANELTSIFVSISKKSKT